MGKGLRPMKEQIKIKLTNLKSEKIWPLAIVITGLLLSASITFASFSIITRKEVIAQKPVETQAVLGLKASASTTPTAIPSLEPSPIIVKIIPSPKPSIKPTPTTIATSAPVVISQSNPNPQNTSPIIIQIVSTPSPSPSSSPSPSPSPSLEPSPSPVVRTVAVEIKQPDATLNFDLEITNEMNVCQVMQKAKDQGKINSISISDKYLESFGTLFVEEINGYKNNWTFTVNGESPNGCSLVTLKNGDKVAWEFLNL